MVGWMLDEMGSAGRENLDPVHVARYDGKEDAGAADEVAEASPHHLSRLALHHLPDFWKGVALARIHRMLRPGGVLRLWDVVYDFEPGDSVDRIGAWCASGGAEAQVEGDWTRAELEEHVRDEHSTFTWLLEPMIRRCGFSIERAEHSEDGISAAYVLRAEGP